MIPLRDVIPSRTTPYVTVTIIILNALAWFFEISMPREELSRFLQVWGVVPAAFIPLTLFSSMFLHGSWSHVIGNMWYLWIFGDNVEDRLGHGRFIGFYLLCGVMGDDDPSLPPVYTRLAHAARHRRPAPPESRSWSCGCRA